MSTSSPDSSSSGRRVLLVMRHATAESFAEEDSARRLTARGQREAVAAGRWMAEQSLVPTHAFVSAATRAVSTWEGVVAGSGTTATPSIEGGLYSGGAFSVLESLRTAPDDAEVVAYVGHNPTAASLAHLLDDGDPDPDAFRGVSSGFPPASVAVLDVTTEWSALDAVGARLVGFRPGGE
jgi:phosphohistidine phosphatase